MRGLLLFAVLIALVVYFYEPARIRLAEVTESESPAATQMPAPTQAIAKCITKDGQVHYGNVDMGLECVDTTSVEITPNTPIKTTVSEDVSNQYQCDGRQHCSQMTSCAEATYFLQYCPNTKMDGDGDGVPCESQWCI